MDDEIKNEMNLLDKEKELSKQKTDGYRNKLIEDLLSGTHPIVHNVEVLPKKSFWQKFKDRF